ncbi:MAG: hypothetical protein H8D56_25795 [Planctomycetes bacterium]|nr:hypothetical protein [Planctomycetota bacterium]
MVSTSSAFSLYALFGICFRSFGPSFPNRVYLNKVRLERLSSSSPNLRGTPNQQLHGALQGHDIFFRDFGVKVIFSFATRVIRGAMLTLRQHAFRLSYNLLWIIMNICSKCLEFMLVTTVIAVPGVGNPGSFAVKLVG